MNWLFDRISQFLRSIAVLILNRKKVFRLLYVLPAFLFVLLLRIFKWKIGEVWTPRLGHLIGNTECYLCERETKKKTLDFFVRIGPVCNSLIYKKYEKHLRVLPDEFGRIVFLVNGLFNDWKKQIIEPIQVDRDVLNLWEKYGPHIGFTKEEEKKGKDLLEDLGIKGKWVSLIVRDSAYLKGRGNFSYHDYRDSDIENYIPAILYLISKGFWVVRMGEIVEKPISLKHERLIDLSVMGKRTEFADLYLGAKCEFCVGTPTGFMSIPQVFQRPLVVTDFVPLEYAPTFSKGLLIWKHHVKDGKRLTPGEIYGKSGQFTFSPLFEQEGITLENNSSAEILDVVSEMVEGSSTKPQDFWKSFPHSISPYNNQPLHGKIKLRVGGDFLRQYE